MKTKFDMIIAFTGEIVFFVLTGFFIAHKYYSSAIITLLFAMIIAGYVGKRIEVESVNQYKGELK